MIDAAPDALEELRARAKPHDPETLQRLFRVLLSRIGELPFASRQEHALEMAVLRLATLPEAESLAALLQKLDALDGAPGPQGGSGGPSPGSGGAAPRGGGRAPVAEAPRKPPERQAAASAPAPVAPVTSVAPEPVAAAPPPVAAPPAPVAIASPASASPLPSVPDEPPLPDDGEYLTAATGEDPRAATPPPPGRSVLSHEQRSALEARVRTEAKAHPRVLEVIEALDAELREVRVDTRALATPSGSGT
jgi:hypothetical protein